MQFVFNFEGAEYHQRQLVDRSDPTYTTVKEESVNPTNGSWWIVQILPIQRLK